MTFSLELPGSSTIPEATNDAKEATEEVSQETKNGSSEPQITEEIESDKEKVEQNEKNNQETEQLEAKVEDTQGDSGPKEQDLQLMSSPENHKENPSDINEEPSTIPTKPNSRMFESYISLFNIQQKQKEVWDRTIQPRLDLAAASEEKYNLIQNSAKINLDLEQPKLEAAPFPTMPNSQELLAHIKATEEEIVLEKRKLKDLIISTRPKVVEFGSVDSVGPEVGLRNCSGVLVGKKSLDSIIKANKAKVQQSHDKNLLHDEITSKYKRVGDYPFYFSDNSQFLAPMLEHIADRKEREYEYNQKLCKEYIERRANWQKLSDNLNNYHKVLHASIDQWPPEFAVNRPKDNDLEKILSVVAPDQIMYNDPEERESYLYFDENMLVEDPVLAHNQFKQRIVWTDQEKQIFMEKYALHPREFKKIANSLPGKTIKDVIEYYHNYRIKLDLKKLEVAARSKGSKRRVITEGSRK